MRSEGKRAARSTATVAAAILGGAVLAGCAAQPASATGSNSIIIQPNPVSPGGTISVFDGGNCDSSSTGIVTFQSDDGGRDIPPITIGPLRNMVGGTGQVPSWTRPGNYEVSLTCRVDGHRKEGPFTGTLIVRSGASDGWNPHGGARTGDGASLTSPGGLAEGAALVLLGGTGWFLLRRRAARSI